MSGYGAEFSKAIRERAMRIFIIAICLCATTGCATEVDDENGVEQVLTHKTIALRLSNAERRIRSSLDLGSVLVGNVQDFAVKIENRSQYNLELASINRSCGCSVVSVPNSTLPRDESIQVIGKFTPKAEDSNHESRLSFVLQGDGVTFTGTVKLTANILMPIQLRPREIELEPPFTDSWVYAEVVNNTNKQLADLHVDFSAEKLELLPPVRIFRGSVEVWRYGVRPKRRDLECQTFTDTITLTADTRRGWSGSIRIRLHCPEELSVTPTRLHFGVDENSRRRAVVVQCRTRVSFEASDISISGEAASDLRIAEIQRLRKGTWKVSFIASPSSVTQVPARPSRGTIVFGSPHSQVIIPFAIQQIE